MPIYEPNPQWLAVIEGKIARHEARIRRSFYTDLFLMISEMDDVRTATEINARREEKMAMLGPVVERVDYEVLDPIIERVLGIMLRQSMPIWAGIIDGEPLLPEPPEELGQNVVEADYISILAQAQKAGAVNGLERIAATIGNLSGAFPKCATSSMRTSGSTSTQRLLVLSRLSSAATKRLPQSANSAPVSSRRQKHSRRSPVASKAPSFYPKPRSRQTTR